MGFLTSIALTMLASWSPQGAPADVPKNHWAYPAVDALFREGLLRGYPATSYKPLQIDKQAKMDPPSALLILKELESKGFVGIYHGMGHIDPLIPYNQAVAAHANWALINGVLSESSESGTPTVQQCLEMIPRVVLLVSVYRKELSLMGADPDEMIQRLDKARRPYAIQFRG